MTKDQVGLVWPVASSSSLFSSSLRLFTFLLRNSHLSPTQSIHNFPILISPGNLNLWQLALLIFRVLLLILVLAHNW